MIQNLEFKAQNEKYFKSLRYFSHNIKGNVKREFITELSEYNIYLAAQCVMSSEKDEEFELQLILKAETLAKDFKNTEKSAKGFLALAEFESFGIISDLLNEVKKPSHTHLIVFIKILEENNPIIFISFIEVLIKVKKIPFIQFALNAYNGPLVVNSENKNILKKLLTLFINQGTFGMARIFLEKFDLLHAVHFILEKEPKDIVDTLFNSSKRHLTANKLAYEICIIYKLFEIFTPTLFIDFSLANSRKSIKFLLFAIKIAIENNIKNHIGINERLSAIFSISDKSKKTKVHQLLKFGLSQYLEGNQILSKKLEIFVSKSPIINSFNKDVKNYKPSTLPNISSIPKLEIEQLKETFTIKDLISKYLDTKKSEKNNIEEFINDILSHYKTNLMEISHLFRDFLLHGTVVSIQPYGVYVSCPIIISSQLLFLHKSQITEQEIVHPELAVSKGDIIPFRVIGINQESLRLNISCLKIYKPDYVAN